MRRRLLAWAVLVLVAGLASAITTEPDDDTVDATVAPGPRVEILDPGPTGPGDPVPPVSTVVVEVAGAPTFVEPDTVVLPTEGEPTPSSDPTAVPATDPSPPAATARQLLLRGRIVDAAGAPVPDACVAASPAGPPLPGNLAIARSGADGTYVIEARDLVVSADPQTWDVAFGDCGTSVPGLLGPSNCCAVTVPLGGEATLDTAMSPGVAVRVHAVDQDGAQVPGFCLHAGALAPVGADGEGVFRTLRPNEALVGTLGCRSAADGSILAGAVVDLGVASPDAGTVADRTVVVPPAPGDSRGAPVAVAVDPEFEGENAFWAAHTLTATGSADEPMPASTPGPVTRSVWATVDGTDGQVGVRASGAGTLGFWQQVGDTLVPVGCLALGQSTRATIDATGPLVVQLAATDGDAFALVYLTV